MQCTALLSEHDLHDAVKMSSIHHLTDLDNLIQSDPIGCFEYFGIIHWMIGPNQLFGQPQVILTNQFGETDGQTDRRPSCRTVSVPNSEGTGKRVHTQIETTDPWHAICQT